MNDHIMQTHSIHHKLWYSFFGQWGATPLEDNLPSDTYHYQVTVNTAVKKKAATRSKVSFILSGDDGDTGVRRLYDGKRKVRPQGFRVDTPEMLQN